MDKTIGLRTTAEIIKKGYADLVRDCCNAEVDDQEVLFAVHSFVSAMILKRHGRDCLWDATEIVLDIVGEIERETKRDNDQMFLKTRKQAK
jgi:hypothetical protein